MVGARLVRVKKTSIFPHVREYGDYLYLSPVSLVKEGEVV